MNPHPLHSFLGSIESHAALTQALAAIVTTLVAVVALVYAVRSLNALQRQTEAVIATTVETFRPLVEVVGEVVIRGGYIYFDIVNKGHGAALNLRWRPTVAPERWMVTTSNVLPVGEKRELQGDGDWKDGLVLSYNSVAHREEIRTYVRFDGGWPSNNHEISQGAAVTRMGWTLFDPGLAVPAWSQQLIDEMPLWSRIKHWWGLKRGLERRL